MAASGVTVGGARMSPAVTISIGEDGVVVPRLGQHPPLLLAPPDLVALSRLAASVPGDGAAAVTGRRVDDGRAAAMMHELSARGLFGEAQPGASRPQVRTGAPVVPATTAPASVPADGVLVLPVPLVLRPAADGRFEAVDHDGEVRARLDPVEVAAASCLVTPRSSAEALAAHAAQAGELALDAAAFDSLVGCLVEAGLARRQLSGEVVQLAAERRRRLVEVGNASLAKCRASIGARVDAYLAEHPAGGGRTRVVPVQVNHTIVPLALGLLYEYAMAYDGGRLNQHYDFVPSWIMTDEQLAELVREPAVVLVSNYVWSHTECLALSARVRQLSPGSVIVHGGPNTPKYPGDVEAYFAAHPHVDVTVRGEGEQTTAELLDVLAGRLGGGPVDLSCLAEVAGLTYRSPDGPVRTADRPRIADLDTIPSPYLSGLFDGYLEAARAGAHFQALLETNRGCPYGCTFCDWGSATMSRVRKFSLERVFAEIEWCARNGAAATMLADANFGMLPRDVEIAEKVAEVRRQHGYPETISLAFAKNSMGNRKRIIEALVGAGIMTEGVVSLQSLSETTLAAVERRNIKVDKYDELATQFRRADLPLWAELMLGLPGSTTESFRNDLQDCIEREVPARINITDLLVNSPMNEPGYRARFAIEADATRPGGLAQVVSTSTYTRADHRKMLAARRDYLLFENLGILRQVSRFVRHATGLREVDLYRRLRVAAEREPQRFPAVHFTVTSLVFLMAPPVSWRLFVDEVRRFVVDDLGVADDDALSTVLAVQHALLPARGRRFPTKLELPHDYVAWHGRMLAAKESGHRHDWPAVVPPLADLPPGQFVVNDPHDVCNLGLGASLEPSMDETWDLESPVSRQHHLKPIPLVS